MSSTPALLPTNIGQRLNILYLHGFLSSPASMKARQCQEFCHQHQIEIAIPELDFEPHKAIEQARRCVEKFQRENPERTLLIIGSSLGGYYATHLANQLNCHVALINPAVRPYLLFADYLGPQEHFYNGQTFILTENHIEQLRRLDDGVLSNPEKILLLLQSGDETLDYRLAADLYQPCAQVCSGGGDHSYQGFIERLPSILHWSLR